MEADTLNQLLDELDAAFGKQGQQWNEQFSRVWDKQLSSLGQAITTASHGLSLITRDALHEKLNQLCTLYFSMQGEQRSAFRKAVASRKHLLWGIRAHIVWAANKIQSPDDIGWLRAGLAAASIEDARIDFRDTLMNLGSLYIAASSHGIEPLEHFKEVARLSSGEETPWKSFRSTQHVLANFEQTAFFQADVKPRLRDNAPRAM
jgi:hypothetical protein